MCAIVMPSTAGDSDSPRRRRSIGSTSDESDDPQAEHHADRTEQRAVAVDAEDHRQAQHDCQRQALPRMRLRDSPRPPRFQRANMPS